MQVWKTLIHNFVDTKSARSDEKTTKWYEARLKHWLLYCYAEQLKPKKVRTKHLDRFFGQMKRDGYKRSTRAGTATALKAFFAWLIEEGKLKKNPFDKFEPLPKERQAVEPIALTYCYQMIRVAEQQAGPYGIRDAAIMRLLLTTGARREEITHLDTHEINLDIGQCILSGKFDHRRVMPLRPTTVTAIRRWLTVRPAASPTRALFVQLHPSTGGLHNRLRPNAINRIIQKWKTAACVPAEVQASPHMWRHRFATEIWQANDPLAVQALLGHSDVSTTSIYVHQSPEVLRELLLRWGPDGPPPEASRT